LDFAGVLYCLICTTDGTTDVSGSRCYTNRFMFQGRGHIFDSTASELSEEGKVTTAHSREYNPHQFHAHPFPGQYLHLDIGKYVL